MERWSTALGFCPILDIYDVGKKRTNVERSAITSGRTEFTFGHDFCNRIETGLRKSITFTKLREYSLLRIDIPLKIGIPRPRIRILSHIKIRD